MKTARLQYFLSSLKAGIFLVLLSFLSGQLSAQNDDPYVDSLQQVIKSKYPDTVKVKTNNELSYYYLFSDLDLSLKYANEAKLLARAIKYNRGLAYGYKWAGAAHYYKGDYLDALEEWKLSVQIFDSINDLIGQSNILSNIGAIFFNQGAFDKALENYSKSLKLAEQAGDKLRIATAFLNIGAVYVEKEETIDRALENYTAALELAEQLEESEQKERALGTAALNIGEIYYKRQDFDRALEYYNQSLQAFKGLDGEPSALIYLSKVYAAKDEFRRAEEFQNQAFELSEANQDMLSAVHALIAMAETQELLENWNSAVFRYKKAVPLAQNIPDAKKDLSEIYNGLSKNFSKTSKYDSAYKYQTLYINLKDTLGKSDKRLDILQRDFELERREIEISQLNVEKELQQDIIARQRIIQILVGLGLVSVAIFLYIALRQKNRIEKEKQRSEELLLNILPYEVAEELKEKGSSEAQHFDEVTVLFTDFKGFTQTSQILTAQELVQEVNIYFKAFDEIVSKYKVEKI